MIRLVLRLFWELLADASLNGADSGRAGDRARAGAGARADSGRAGGGARADSSSAGIPRLDNIDERNKGLNTFFTASQTYFLLTINDKTMLHHLPRTLAAR